MSYQRSFALMRWLGQRRVAIDQIAQAHADLGEVDGPGRPLEIGKPLAHAYIIRVVAEFQGFTRDLHDLAAEHLVTVADPPDTLTAILLTAMTKGRAIDTGNATMTAVRTDFARLGLRNLEGRLGSESIHWNVQSGGDPKRLRSLIEMRNALAHGNQRQVDEFRRQGRADTVSWGRQQLPVLNRAARALDRVVFDHLTSKTDREPW